MEIATAQPPVMIPHTLIGNGKLYHFFKPDISVIDIETIAATLSKICRWGGNPRRFYSVAEHCVRCSYIGPHHEALERLMHDASEFVVQDMITPLKVQPGMERYREADHIAEQAIATRFHLIYPWPPSVKKADLIMLATELRELLPANDFDWPHLRGVEALPDQRLMFSNWEPKYWESQFLARFEELTP